MSQSEAIRIALIAFREVIRGKLSAGPKVKNWFNENALNRFNELAREFNALKVGMPLTTLSPTSYGILSPPPDDVLSQLDVAIHLLSTDAPVGVDAPSGIVQGGLAPASTQAADRTKPRVFIGSSVEGLDVAKVIQLNLQYKATGILWSQGVFGLSDGTLETLVNNVSTYDYAILVLTADDIVVKRDQAKMSARDNVLFELGLFMGALGRQRTFIVCPRKLALPTDLAGITPAVYDPNTDANIQSHLGPVCTQLEIAMGLL